MPQDGYRRPIRPVPLKPTSGPKPGLKSYALWLQARCLCLTAHDRSARSLATPAYFPRNTRLQAAGKITQIEISPGVCDFVSGVHSASPSILEGHNGTKSRERPRKPVGQVVQQRESSRFWGDRAEKAGCIRAAVQG